MRHILVLSLGLLLSCPAAFAADPPHAQLQFSLAPSLGQWVAQEAKDIGDATPDVDAIGAAARERLAGQEFTDTDIEALVQLVLQECARQADEELRDMMAQIEAINGKKQAQREAADALRKQQQGMKQELRGSYTARAQLSAAATDQAATPVKPIAAAATVAEPKDSLSDTGEFQELRLQKAQDRREKLYEILANVMKKTSDTSASITANLK